MLHNILFKMLIPKVCRHHTGAPGHSLGELAGAGGEGGAAGGGSEDRGHAQRPGGFLIDPSVGQNPQPSTQTRGQESSVAGMREPWPRPNLED